MIDRIATERGYVSHMSRHSVYEWEDIFCQNIPAELFYLENKFGDRLKKHTIAKKVRYKTSKTEWKLAFVINAGKDAGFRKDHIIPVYLDFPSDSILPVLRNTQKLPAFFVTNYQIFLEMREQYHCENCFYVPLTVADQYYTEEIPEKEIDVVQVGRKNKVLHEYMLEYCSAHPDIEYVCVPDDSSAQGYVSTRQGGLGRMESRQQYMDLLRKSKVSLVSSPASDEGRKDFRKEHDFITPRFYESAAAYCWLIGRYSNNEDAVYQGLHAVCPSIKNYEEFSRRMDFCLKADIKEQKNDYVLFIKNHLTSKAVREVKQVLEDKGFQL